MLYDVFSVVVHLSPAPVVVRVPTVAVTGWLADRGYPVVPPSPLVPREPVRRDGFSMTFWQFVEQLPDAEPDMGSRIEQTARLHAALRNYDAGDLGFWAPFGTYIPEGLAELKRLPDLIDEADLERAQRRMGRHRADTDVAQGF